MLFDIDIHGDDLDVNGEFWEANVFDDEKFEVPFTRQKKTLVQQRAIWKAVYANDINDVQRLLREAPSHIFTYINIRDAPSQQHVYLPHEFNLNDDHNLKEARFTNVVMKAAELGHCGILDLIITAIPSSIHKANKVCVY